MDSYDDLKRALRKLRHRVNELEGGPARKAEAEANAIVSGGNADGRGAWAAGIAQSRKARRDSAVLKLQDELIAKPWLVDSSSGVGNLRARFGQDIPAGEIDQLVDVVYRDRHHHPSHVEQRSKDNAEVIDLIGVGLDSEAAGGQVSNDTEFRKRPRIPGF